MRLWYRLQAWWRTRRNPPAVIVEYFGQATPRPQVCVSIRSTTGGITVFADTLTEQSDAHATLTARSLSHIAHIRLVDLRGCGDFQPDLDVPTYCADCTRGVSQHPEFFGRGSR